MCLSRTATFLSALAIAVSIGCRADSATTPGERQIPGIGPDTASLGLAPVDGAPLFALVDESTAPDSVRQRLASLRTMPWAVVVRLARLTDGADTLLTVGRAVAFEVSPTRRLVFRGDARTVHLSGAVSWTGTLQGGLPGQASVLVSSIGASGDLVVLASSGAAYWFQPVGDHLLAIIYVDESRLPLD